MSYHQPSVCHLKVCGEKGKFAGWPANSGIWNWGNEILCGFTLAEHKEKSGHTYDPETAVQKFARSRDGGKTWTVEDACERGITAKAKNHNPTCEPAQPTDCQGGFDFTHPDFAMTLRRMSDADGPAHFYITQDRGHHWAGPYLFPLLGTRGILARTDYMIEGSERLTAFLTASKSNGKEGRVGCFRTCEAGRSWHLVSWLDDEPDGFSIMPASVRVSDSRVLCVVRRRENGRNWLAGYISDDNCESWRYAGDPVKNTGKSGNPPAMVRHDDGRICLAYCVRSEGPEAPSRVCVRFSEDGGERWSDEIVLRGDDGASGDIGYPRIARRPDGRLVLLYYYNHALRESPSFRYIAATIFETEILL